MVNSVKYLHNASLNLRYFYIKICTINTVIIICRSKFLFKDSVILKVAARHAKTIRSVLPKVKKLR